MTGITRRQFAELSGLGVAGFLLPSFSSEEMRLYFKRIGKKPSLLTFDTEEGTIKKRDDYSESVLLLKERSGNLEEIVNYPQWIISPKVSPDENYLAYCLHRDHPVVGSWNHDTEGDLHILNLKTKEEVVVSDPTSEKKYEGEIAWRGDSKKLVLSVGRGNPEHFDFRWYGAHSINPDGSEEQFLMDARPIGHVRSPCYSPEGRNIVYHENGTIRIFDGEMRKTVIDMKHFPDGTSWFPKWSPRGDLIIFVSDKEKENEYKIYFTSPDGNTFGLLVPDKFYSLGVPKNPGVWSPDGSRVAFQPDKDGECNIYTYNVDTGKRTQVTREDSKSMSAPRGKNTDKPVLWTPDGKGVIYEALRGIYRINLNGSDLKQLTDNHSDEIIGYFGVN